MTAITPLEAWIGDRTGLTGPLADRLAAWQLQRLNAALAYGRDHTPFYGRRLAEKPPLASLSELSAIPFTWPADLVVDPGAFLAVRQDDIARIVTLRSSGSSGEAKRLFFTEDDLELTLDFFHHGMATMVGPGDKVAVLLPGERPDSVGDLLVRALQRMEVEAVALGPLTDPPTMAARIAAFGACCLVGIPTQVLALARRPEGAALGGGRLRSVLLSTDYVPKAITQALEDAWGCRVFSHYGMTEMGLGGGVECAAQDGYHLRENDLYVEIVDHRTGTPCDDGVLGEVVFTTLTWRGMPLIRYRTGDMARMLSGPCRCGSVLRRMEPVRGRWQDIADLGGGCSLTLAEMDEQLFRLPGLLDFRVEVTCRADGRFAMLVEVQGSDSREDLRRALSQVEAIRTAIAHGSLDMPELRVSAGGWPTTGVAKRKILTLTAAPPGAPPSAGG